MPGLDSRATVLGPGTSLSGHDGEGGVGQTDTVP